MKKIATKLDKIARLVEDVSATVDADGTIGDAEQNSRFHNIADEIIGGVEAMKDILETKLEPSRTAKQAMKRFAQAVQDLQVLIESNVDHNVNDAGEIQFADKAADRLMKLTDELARS